MFIDVLFTIAEVWKHLECPVTDERIRSVCVCVCVCVYVCPTVYSRILLRHKKE